MSSESAMCLICREEVEKLSSPPYPSLLDKHLEVIFLLRKVLEVPVAQLAIYLEGCPSVEGWISVCDSCTEAVKQCKLIYQENLESNRKWRECKQEIVNVIKVTKEEKRGEDNDRIVPGVMSISQNTRLFVKCHSYGDYTDPFIAGDLKAAEILQNLVAKLGVKWDVAYRDNAQTTPSSHVPDKYHASSGEEYSSQESSDSSLDDDNESHFSVKKKNAGANKAKVAKRKYIKRNNPEVPEKSLSLTQFKDKLLRKNRPSNEPVDCQVCGRTLSSQHRLNHHLFNKHAIGTAKHQCPRCFKMVATTTDFKVHIAACAKSSDPKARGLHTDEHFMPPGNHFRIKCPVPGCPLHWPIVSAYRNHLQTQHTSEEREGVSKKPKILECLTCGKVVRSKREAKVHRFSHDESLRKEDEIVCEFCGLTIQGKRGLIAHQQNSLQCRLLRGQTESEATVVCDICGKRATCKKTLKDHLLRMHHKKFKCLCARCGKGFMDSKSLTIHLAQVHGIVEDKRVELKCPVEGCGKIFYHKASWRDHQKGVHKQGEPDQKCKECGKAFYTYRSLSQHVNVVHRGRRRKPKMKPGITEEEGPSLNQDSNSGG